MHLQRRKRLRTAGDARARPPMSATWFSTAGDPRARAPPEARQHRLHIQNRVSLSASLSNTGKNANAACAVRVATHGVRVATHGVCMACGDLEGAAEGAA
jgi:hypothetical protein